MVNKCNFTYGLTIGEIDPNTMKINISLDKFLTTKGIKNLIDNNSSLSDKIIDTYGDRF